MWNEKGFQTQESFSKYIKEVFYPSLIARGITLDERNRVFLYLDGHPSHEDPYLLKWCKDHFIEIFLLYPNATRILQMCDVAMFSPAKAKYHKKVSFLFLKRNFPGMI
jgi:hypothetical protein